MAPLFKPSPTHTGFEKLAEPQAERDSHVEGWVRSQALEELKQLVESK